MVEKYKPTNNVSLDYICELVEFEIKQDGHGVPKHVEKQRKRCFCGVLSVGRNEYYTAAQTGLEAEYTIILNAFEYGGEECVDMDGKLYTVYRTYRRPDDYIELYLAKRLGRERI